ncbi:Gmad2 immunoglobulin-like domain-containing protein [Neobacillus mesonae]|uniref:Gmad2 immunoglobulin-like domain-containing protein n=1 Tax=Neobacillus mesonae TaxID=1193713 RepID=UPI0020414320|nr:Gmad2 immunoglobulin-like domain-containing protein [Neobacillus mesonae]MCM3567312.1 Gmad2 immunoglobulin-like domain-containing protein [Neobacillus mesonae]
MKKVLYFLLGLIAALGLAACSQPEDSNVQTSKEEKPVTVEPVKEGPAKEEAEEISDKQVYQNEVFKHVVVKESRDQLVVTGRAQVFEGGFQYKLYDNDKVLLEDHYQTDGAPAWGDFTITLDKKWIASDNVTFELFVYSAKDGLKINVLKIPIPH